MTDFQIKFNFCKISVEICPFNRLSWVKYSMRKGNIGTNYKLYNISLFPFFGPFSEALFGGWVRCRLGIQFFFLAITLAQYSTEISQVT